MSARLERSLERAATDGGLGLVPYITAGDGGYDATLGALEACSELGAAAIELGSPFREPVADGPTLIAAAGRALEAGARFERTLDCLRRFRELGHETPVLLFSYANPLVARGLDASLDALRDAGADGLMVPDIPFEESGTLLEAADRRGLALVPFVAPTTGDERLARIAHSARGFLYLVARTGITGRASRIDADLVSAIERARSAGARRVGVGFGLRSPDQIAALVGHAELAIVGSALVDAIHAGVTGASDPRGAARAATADFLTSLLEAAASGALR